MGFDAHKNGALGTVSVAPSPATSGTSLTLTTGDAAHMPAVPFNATVWPANAQVTPTNFEIVRVTNVAGEVCTITRTQESSTARAIVIGDQFMAGLTTKSLTDVEATFGSYAPIVVWSTTWAARPAGAPMVIWSGPATAGTPAGMNATTDVWVQTRDQVAPAQVAGVASTAGDRQLTLTWTANTESDLHHYLVYLDGAVVLDSNGNAIQYTTATAVVTGLTNLHTYSAQVSAVDTSSNEGTKSTALSNSTTEPIDLVNPNAPTSLAPYAVAGDSEIDIYFTASTSTDAVATYLSYSSDGGTTWSVEVSVNSPAAVAGLTNGTSYNFRLRALDDDGNHSTYLQGGNYSGIVPIATADQINTFLDELHTNGGVYAWYYAKEVGSSATNDQGVVGQNIADAGSVSTWKDGSGNGRDLTVQTGTKPTYKNANTNYGNRPTIDFAGASYAKTATGTANVQPFCVMAIGNFGAASGVGEGMVDGLGTSARWCFVHSSAGSFQLKGGGANNLTSTVPYDTSPHSWLGILNDASSSFYVGGTLTSGTTATDGHPTGVTVGGVAGGTSLLNGSIALVVILTRAPTSQEISDFLAASVARTGVS